MLRILKFWGAESRHLELGGFRKSRVVDFWIWD